MEVASPSTPGPTGGLPAHPILDPLLVVEHLVAVLEVTLGATRRTLDSVGSLLHSSRYPDTLQRCSRFATESQTALYVQKDLDPEQHEEAQVDG